MISILLLLTFTSFSSDDLPSSVKSLIGQNVETVSEAFLGTPYVLDPLGEGKNSPLDKDPLYRFDQFDCTTYVETVIALSKSKTPDEFLQLLNKIRYSDSKPDYFHRNHFIEVDWLPNNIKNGSIEVITQELFDTKLLKMIKVTIDKNKWFKSKNKTPPTDETKLTTWINFLPIEKIMDDPKLLDRIPSGTFFNLVKLKPHSPGAVAHQGIFIRKDGILLARHATRLSRDAVIEMNALGLIRMYFKNQESEGVKSAGLSFFKIN